MRFLESLVSKLLALLLIASFFVFNPSTIQAQAVNNTGTRPDSAGQARTSVFLPLISNTSSQPTKTPSINAISHLTDSPKQDNPVLTPNTEATNTPSEPVNNGPIKSIQCSTRNWTATQVREMGDTILLNSNAGIIYPGALIQGKDLEDGRFTSITIPRAGGKIWLQGLKLAPDAQYSRTLSEISGSNVKQAIEDILSGPIQGTAASAYMQTEQTYSYEEMAFKLGVDARYGLASMKASLNVGSKEKKNYVFMKFAQVFYDVYFEEPTLSTSVFRDGEKFQDPEHQISSDNPPLYVQKISYGRMVFFVAESDYSAKDVEIALQAAYKGVAGSAEVDSGATFQEVMENTKVYYSVIGGDAGLALQPIESATPADMYDKVKNFLGNKEAADFSASNPGLPIAYTLHYLSDRSLARLSYSVVYNANDCEPLVALPFLNSISVNFHTTNDDKDGDTNVHVLLQCGGQNNTPETIADVAGTWGYFNDNSDSGPIALNIVNQRKRANDIYGNCSIVLVESPNGHDEWHFNWTVKLTFADDTARTFDFQGGNVDYDRTTIAQPLK